MTFFISLIVILLPTARGVASQTTNTSWILDDIYSSQELNKMAANEKTGRLAFHLLKAKNQYLALKKDNEVLKKDKEVLKKDKEIDEEIFRNEKKDLMNDKKNLTKQNEVLGETLEFYECCCSTLLFAATLDKVSNYYWYRAFTNKKRTDPEKSDRYKNCMNFMKEGIIGKLPKPDQETKKKAETFRNGFRKFLMEYSREKRISLDTGIQEFCLSQWKCYEIINTVIHELDSHMKALDNFRKQFRIPIKLSKGKCIPYSTKTNLILNQTDLMFVNNAIRFIPSNYPPLHFVLQRINNYGDKAVITDSCKNNNYIK